MPTEHGTEDVRHLEEWLAGRRWYGDKARELREATTLLNVRIPENDFEIDFDLVRLGYSSGPDATYLLVRDANDPSGDGVEHAEVRSWLLEGFGDARVLPSESDLRLRWVASDELRRVARKVAGDSRVFRGEQSNSSIVFGSRVMVKLFRKIRPGTNPEVEVGDFLTRHTAFRAFPRLLGVLNLESGETSTTLAAVQEFVPSNGDAWDWITGRINDPSGRVSTIDAAHMLGVRTGEMHVAFASGESNAFAPEVATAAYAGKVRDEAKVELQETIERLDHRGVGGATGLGESLERALGSLQQLEGTMITRIHGDYHLGQVLRTEHGDFAILDFEGEPTRPLSERRAKSSPLRDVAGMLRSFDYAAETARRSSGGRVDAEVTDWYQRSRQAFLDGYNAAIAQNAVLLRGWDDSSWPSVLAAFEVHKALYEVRYELGNRPDWLEIPLTALRRLTSHLNIDSP